MKSKKINKRKYVKKNTIKKVNKKTKSGKFNKKYNKKTIKSKRFRGGRHHKDIKEIVAEVVEAAEAAAAEEAARVARLNEAAIWADNMMRIEAEAAAQGRTLEPSLIARSYNDAPDAYPAWYSTLRRLDPQVLEEMYRTAPRTILSSVSSAHEHTDTPLLITRRRSNRRPSTLSS